jgi:glycosyltransferase involved in cell wall biosynthesis
MVTYNHARYIRQAIESVLAQKATFPYELVIGEDCSQDETRQIVSEYYRGHPDRVRLIISETNVGARKNFNRTFQACRGQYIAILEGDDYWTSVDKLQKQVNFLDSSPAYSMVFHNVAVSREHEQEDENRSLHCADNLKETLTFYDLLRNNYICTLSVMFRRSTFDGIPPVFDLSIIGDWPIHLLNAEHGNVRYLKEVMGVYRIHSQGLFSQKNNTDWYKAAIQMYDCLERHYEHRYNTAIRLAKFRWLYALALEQVRNEGAKGAHHYVQECLWYRPLYLSTPSRIKLLMWLHTPILARMLADYVSRHRH